MFKSKVPKVLAIGLVIVVALLAFVSCQGAAPTTVEPERTIPPSVTYLPVSGAPGALVTVVGANFIPGEVVEVRFLMQPDPKALPVWVIIGGLKPGSPFLEAGYAAIVIGEPVGTKIRVNDTGSFQINEAKLPPNEGVWPVRVYDEKGEVIATSTFLSKKPPAAK